MQLKNIFARKSADYIFKFTISNLYFKKTRVKNIYVIRFFYKPQITLSAPHLLAYF